MPNSGLLKRVLLAVPVTVAVLMGQTALAVGDDQSESAATETVVAVEPASDAAETESEESTDAVKPAEVEDVEVSEVEPAVVAEEPEAPTVEAPEAQSSEESAQTQASQPKQSLDDPQPAPEPVDEPANDPEPGNDPDPVEYTPTAPTCDEVADLQIGDVVAVLNGSWVVKAGLHDDPDLGPIRLVFSPAEGIEPISGNGWAEDSDGAIAYYLGFLECDDEPEKVLPEVPTCDQVAILRTGATIPVPGGTLSYYDDGHQYAPWVLFTAADGYVADSGSGWAFLDPERTKLTYSIDSLGCYVPTTPTCDEVAELATGQQINVQNGYWTLEAGLQDDPDLGDYRLVFTPDAGIEPLSGNGWSWDVDGKLAYYLGPLECDTPDPALFFTPVVPTCALVSQFDEGARIEVENGYLTRAGESVTFTATNSSTRLTEGNGWSWVDGTLTFDLGPLGCGQETPVADDEPADGDSSGQKSTAKSSSKKARLPKTGV